MKIDKIWIQDRITFGAKYINENNNEIKNIIDIGCRDEILKEKIDPSIKYQGVDIYPIKPSTIYANVENGIPFDDNNFSLAVALDVLEHTNNIDKVVSELRRVSKGYLINLPNEISFWYRIKLLFGVVSKKFLIDLSSLDRHRWFFNLDNVARLVDQTDLKNDKTSILALYRTKKNIISRIIFSIGYYLGLHSLFAHSFIILGKKNT